jgi:UDP-N-acetylmuramoylalanine--D-glutamate ligase
VRGTEFRGRLARMDVAAAALMGGSLQCNAAGQPADATTSRSPLPRALSEAEVETLIAAATQLPGYRGAEARAAIELLYSAGLRASELVSLPTAALREDQPLLAIRGMGGRERLVPISAQAPQHGGIWAEGALLRDAAGVIADLTLARALPGAHNAQNAAAASAAALALGLTRAEVADGLLSYPGLPHRQELVADINGVRFINDSKATNADSAVRALASYGRVVWIAGGQAKADGIGPLAPFFPRIAHAVLIGEAAPAFAQVLAQAGVSHEILGTLDTALPVAAAAAFSGAAPVVLLSPACASWDQFTGFEQRGDRFRDLVLVMKERT